MTAFQEKSAGVIPFRGNGSEPPVYLVLHSATVRNPRAKWEFPKGGVETGESTREAAAREFEEETGIGNWRFRDGWERTLSYTYVRRGRKVLKTVTYYIVEVLDDPRLVRSPEHVEDTHGHWYHWGQFDQIVRLLYHAKIRQLFAEADAWLKE
jgi:8-oxo-dGTP pyrophosphatase MutT (NUDIX family)